MTDIKDRLSALIVDDDEGFRASLGLLVELEGFEIHTAASLSEAREHLAGMQTDVTLLDLGLPDGDGIQLLRDEEIAGCCEFIVITGNASVESAVQALRDGALDYLTKPVDRARLKSILAGVLRTREIKAEVRGLRVELRQLGRFERLVGRSAVMQRVYDLIGRVAPTRASVLLTGESGTGKEIVAEAIHRLSRRRNEPFLAVNCGAIASTLIESELFGHERGSFTGAESSHRGYFEKANGGTLFLDEVSDMSPELQRRLLRVLETGAILRVGGSDVVPVDVRVIAATNREPAQAVRDRVLREDLYYRLNVFPIVLPPLRQRGEDIELLADYFLNVVNARDGVKKRWSSRARTKLQTYPWPGNVRELKNAVERAAILSNSSIGPELLPGGEGTESDLSPPSGSCLHIHVGEKLDEVERRLILTTLEQCKGDKRLAARTLGIGLKTLYTRLNVYRASGRTDLHDRSTAASSGIHSLTTDEPFVESAMSDLPFETTPSESRTARPQSDH